MSAYEVWLVEGNTGTRKDFLDSLKGYSVEIKSIDNTENGVKIILTDKSGDHEIVLTNGINGQDGQDGYSPTVTAETTEGGHNLIIQNSENNIQTIFIPDGENGDKGDQGEQGPTGTDGREVVFMHDRSGVLYWRYSETDDNWKELIDLGHLIDEKIDESGGGGSSDPMVIFVDELPAPEDALPGVIYILREEG